MDEHDRMGAMDSGWSGAVDGGGTNPLEQLKRASLRQQAQRMAWEFGALVRRVHSELPDMHSRMRSALEALQLLSGRLSGEEGAAPTADVILPAARPVRNEAAGSRAAQPGRASGRVSPDRASDRVSDRASGGSSGRASGGVSRPVPRNELF